MKISLLDVQQVFNDLLNHKISREDAEEWARKRMNALDNQDLIFDPPIKEELLWKAVIYLSGVGLKISPDTYMEDDIGIKEMFNRPLAKVVIASSSDLPVQRLS
ncbi:hypothetical protein [Acinetobacter baumannii]|uniref:hypothetical protein n=14 Tax=Acinetobacter baumannii TaxID=470 RepID=UPI001D17D596|nr:hypothetical protein [Acinetobacter baumannii]